MPQSQLEMSNMNSYLQQQLAGHQSFGGNNMRRGVAMSNGNQLLGESSRASHSFGLHQQQNPHHQLSGGIGEQQLREAMGNDAVLMEKIAQMLSGTEAAVKRRSPEEELAAKKEEERRQAAEEMRRLEERVREELRKEQQKRRIEEIIRKQEEEKRQSDELRRLREVEAKSKAAAAMYAKPMQTAHAQQQSMHSHPNPDQLREHLNQLQQQLQLQAAAKQQQQSASSASVADVKKSAEQLALENALYNLLCQNLSKTNKN